MAEAEERVDDQVTITVDGRQMHGLKGALLWEVCRANGVDIPIFCYHTKLGPVGACRTCLVEQAGVTKGPITACSTPIVEGMEIRTRSATVQKAQRGIFEFLLANHPLDCPICDRGGECPLQDQTFSFGPGTSRYVEPKRHHVKPIALGPTIALDRERCVLCWRCVRFCSDVAEDSSIVLLDRGDHTVVGTSHDKPYVSNFSGNVVELCPVGALTSRKQRFNFRAWELQNRPSVCPHCPMGCNINVSVRKGDEVIRFLSRDNPAVDNSWLCDRGRYDFEFINSPDRIKSPMIKRNGSFIQVSWDEALKEIALRLQDLIEVHGPDCIAGIASPRLTNEDLFTFKRFMRETLGSERVDHFPRADVLGVRGLERSRDTLFESQGAIDDLFAAKTIVVMGGDPSTRAPVLELRIREAVNKFGARLLVLSNTDIAMSSKASVNVRYDSSSFVSQLDSLLSTLSHVESTGRKPAENVGTQSSGGPTVVIYDDAFPGLADPVPAYEAVAAFVTATHARTLPLLDDCNSMGARFLGVVPTNAGSQGSVLQGARAALICGADVAAATPVLRQQLLNLEFLVVQELVLSETAMRADVVLPAASFAEKRGTLTNLEGRVQLLQQALPAPGIARADWEILVDLSQHFDTSLDYSFVEDVWDDISAHSGAFADFRYEDIGPHGTRLRALQPV